MRGTARRGPRAASAAIVGAIVVVALVLPGAARAERWARSQRPHWEVGSLDPRLSRACRLLRFNQQRDHRRHIGFAGEQGRGSTGIAQKAWNLRDPDGLARRGLTYHFADDGLSTCRVFVAGTESGD